MNTHQAHCVEEDLNCTCEQPEQLEFIDKNGRAWSAQQGAIFKHTETKPLENLVVRARAGTGKTTTILAALDYAPEARICVTSFSKAIVDELKARIKNPRAEARSLHSLGLSYLRNRPEVVKWRGEALARRVMGLPDDERHDGVPLVVKLAGLLKNKCPHGGDFAAAVELAEAHDVLPGLDENYDERDVARWALEAVELSLEPDGTIDFDDMIHVPVRMGLVRPRYDLMIVDEAQDMNATQLLLARQACKGRMIIVGDDRQAIYSFRGADSGAIDRLKKELNATELGLTVTYRCPSKVVDLAQKLVPDYKAAPNAAEGTVRTIGYQKLAENAKPGDFVLSRKNAPLAGAALALIRSGVPAKVAGTEVAGSLLGLLKKWSVGNSVPKFLERLSTWEQREIERAEKRKHKSAREARKQVVTDTAETLRTLCEGVSNVAEVRQRIEGMFVDEKENPHGVVLCSSIHRAKGAERDRVFLFGETLYPTGDRTKIEEQNLEYVGITRAKKELVWVTGVCEQAKARK